MMKSEIIGRLIIGLVLLAVIQSTVSTSSVDSVTSRKGGGYQWNQGSMEGGTLLWIKGTGFAPNSFDLFSSNPSINTVQLVNSYTVYDCKIRSEDTTDTQLTCYTPAMAEGTYQVRVYVNDYLIPLNAYSNLNYTNFRALQVNTPSIVNISPVTGLPQRLVTLSGDFKTNCYTTDTPDCYSDSAALISRIYIGGQVCNIIDPATGTSYSTVNSNYLQCLFESNAVGIFNVTMVVTNEYGRSATDPNLYRLSATGQLYTFQTYALISDISPSNGSVEGGTVLTINGQYFSDSSRYPLLVNIDDQPCTILSTNLTTIRCQTSPMPTNNQSHYHGGRGLHAFYERVYTNLSTSIPMPSVNASMTWLEEASFASQNASNSSVWLIGYLRPPMNVTMTFLLDTNVESILFLSTDDNPDHKVQIANSSSLQSDQIPLQNNTNYYMICIGSTQNENISLSIKAKMKETISTAMTNSSAMEMQKIDFGADPILEHQKIVYSAPTTVNGIAEIQDIPIFSISPVQFQLGFRGVYTRILDDTSGVDDVQAAINELPTIYPLSVLVKLIYVSFRITFPIEMGNIPPLVIISSAYGNARNATEIVNGTASGSKLAFQLDGAITHYLDFWNENITNEILQTEFSDLFTIRCPPSLNNLQVTPSIVYANDFENGNSYDGTIPLTDSVFCGRNRATYNSSTLNLVTGNTGAANYMCFAYKLTNGTTVTMNFNVSGEEDLLPPATVNISLTSILTPDARWHYVCIDLYETFSAYDPVYSAFQSFIISTVQIQTILVDAMFDTVTLRNLVPNGYEDAYIIDSSDQASSNLCTFPFLYNGQYYNKCTLDENNLPICRSASNQTYYCQSSSIEGVRRLLPKYQLFNDLLSITHLIDNRTIDISFRYTNCNSPTLIKALPSTHATITSITTASKPIVGTYDIMFKGHTYSAIPVTITASNLADLLQSYSTFGYVRVTREGECARYSYTIEWLLKGDQPLISIVNSTGVTPIGTLVNTSLIQQGNDGNIFYNLPNDMIRTYHSQPQVEVLVGGYPSYCSNVNNSCQFQFLVDQTPTMISLAQNGTNLTINGNRFSSSPQSNTVSIGDSGSCDVSVATTTKLICTIMNSPSGRQVVKVNVDGKGFAASNGTFTVNVSLAITSFEPNTGGAGGGYLLTVYGDGFSSNAKVTIDGNGCTSSHFVNFSTIECTVPPARTQNTSRVVISVIDGTTSVNASGSFAYNTTNTPMISSIEPSVVSMTGGLLNITGAGFGDSLISVFVGTMSALILTSSNNRIQIVLPQLPPGLYPVSIQTSTGPAQSPIQIEYRFYIQQVFPQIVSLYGGTDVYIQGEGFDNGTSINFLDQTNRLYPCEIVTNSSRKIQCRTMSFVQKVTITADGIDPSYGQDFAWSSPRQSVEQGTIVTWSWSSSEILSNLTYNIQQVENAYDTQPLMNGFDSGPASPIGSFSYQFNTLGTFYYWSPIIYQSQGISMRGIVDVIPSQPQILSAQATSNNFIAQTCVFPFTFNSLNYTQCTSVNDTRLWCSPTSIYTGQRFYCTPANPTLNSSCSSNTSNTTLCGQIMPSSLSATQMLATLCTVSFITSMSPTEGNAGTLLTIIGRGFNGQLCEYDVEIGSSYHCLLINITSTQLTCRIENGSMLDSRNSYTVRVTRLGQGYLGSDNELNFRFLTSIFSISPNIGSIDGGTQVTIEGDGFITNSTQLYTADTDYTTLITVTYSRITFTTLQQTTYPDLNVSVSVRVGVIQSVCMGPCTFCWANSVTPILISVVPLSIHGPTNLTFTGQNLLGGGGTYIHTHLTISGTPCNVTGMSNDTVNCSIVGAEVGVYQVVGSIDGVGNIRSSVNITSEAIISSVSPGVSSIYGGALMNIIGNGFPNNLSAIYVMIGLNPCSIIQIANTRIQCFIPAQDNSSDVANITVYSNMSTFSSSFSLNYSATITPNITSINATIVNGSNVLQITGDNFVPGNTSVKVGNSSCSISNLSLTSITCTISSDLGAGRYPVVAHVDTIGNSNSDIFYTHNLVVSTISPAQGSYGGGLSVTVFGQGFNAVNITVSICNRSCASMTVMSNTQLICVIPNVSMSEVNGSCNLTVTVEDISQNALFTYASNLTANVASINPIRGGTGGGTILTIQGIHFANSIAEVSVSIGNVPCLVQATNLTTIICRTSSGSKANLQAYVSVFINGTGYAISSVQFQYMDLWSSRWTWGGSDPPEAGSIVSIDSGARVFLDVVTPVLKLLIIDTAMVIFDDSQDVELNVEYIVIVNGGVLQVGTESNPFQHSATITLFGNLRSIELPIFGAKVIALRNGTLDLHGKPTVRTWTQLGATAVNGSSSLQLLKPVNWSINSEIIIATTGDRFSQRESEVRRITNISSDGLTLTLNEPLMYTHLGVTQQVNTTSIEVRGEVGLLSHNVIVQGSVTETWNETIPECPGGYNPDEFAVQTCFQGRYGEEIGSDQFGAIIMASEDTNDSNSTQEVVIRLSNVELYNVGQAFRLNRFPLNFYMNANMSLSYVKSCSIHYSFNRAINIQATDYVTVENNVIYDIMGSAVFLADGVEIGNAFRGNLAVLVQASSSLLNEDLSPAAFWLTNPNNIVENNAVAGCSHYGYWYQFQKQPDGLSAEIRPDYCPYQQPFGSFHNNSVHSSGRYGVWIYPQYAPTVSGACNDPSPSVAVFEGLVSWKNNKGMEWVMSRTVQIKNAIVFDNEDTGISCITAINHQDFNPTYLRPTFYNAENGSSVINSVIIGDSRVSNTPILSSTIALVVMWDRGLLVQNVTFIHFPSNQTPAIFGPIIPDRCITRCGGWLTKFSNLSFIDVNLRGKFRWPYDGVYQDDDGTLSGQNQSMIIIRPDSLINASSACVSAPYFENAIQCPQSDGRYVRFGVNETSPYYYYQTQFTPSSLLISDEYNHSTSVSWFAQELTNSNGYMMVLKVNQTYRIDYNNIGDWYGVQYSAIVYDLMPGDFLIIQHRMFSKPLGAFSSESTTPLSGVNNSDGDWFYNNNSQIFSYIIKNSLANELVCDMKIDFIMCTCPYCTSYGCPTTTPSPSLPPTIQCHSSVMVLHWSNDADWAFITGSSGKPSDDSVIIVPVCVKLIIDYPLPRIRTLVINGLLEFQQDRNHSMYVDNIIIDGGLLVAGSNTTPFSETIDIVLTGNTPLDYPVSFYLPSNTPRIIAVKGGLDLHGLPHNTIWTRLAQTASAGQPSISLSQSVDWQRGDEIVITTTDRSVSHTERHTIADVINGTLIRTVNPLAYTHLVLQRTFSNGQTVSVAAAVGLLTRNVRVINYSSGPDQIGVRIFIAESLSNANNKGFASLSNIQFLGFGKFDDTLSSDQQAGIYMSLLGDWSSERPTYIHGCSFDGGFNAAISMTGTNGISITNNVIYNTYRSGIVVTGRNHVVSNNLVTAIYWSGTAQQSYIAEFNMNYDGAIMSRNAVSVTMQNNLVAGVERLAYRIQGDICAGTRIPAGISNDYSNNEAHSAMSGVNLWPSDRGFVFDQQCVLIKGFKVYKAWYYGFYINTARNITIDSCTSIDSEVGIFTFVIGPSAVTHLAVRSRVTIQNSVIVGSITLSDCADIIDPTSANIRFAFTAIPTVSTSSTPNMPRGRVGIVFPTFSQRNNMPYRSWTGIANYPCLDGSMSITNSVLGYFNDVCDRRDTAIQVSQSNDDGQFPITTNQIIRENIPDANLVFNGKPNLNKVNPNDCGDMDCDGLKKDLVIDTDGSLFLSATSVFSIAESFWGDQQHGIGDFRIPAVAMTNLTGDRINISSIYPFRGISRSNSCSIQQSWDMYRCNNTTNYRMLIIESMDADSERRRLSPVAIMSNSGYIDLINGPSSHSICNGYTCRRRLSTFMAIVQSEETYQIYFTGMPPPTQTRFRLINANSSIKCILALYYNSRQEIDVYANNFYVSPTNRDRSSSTYSLLDLPNNVTLSSPVGANYFSRTLQLAYFLIDGNTVIDLKVSPLLILSFGLPPIDPASIFTGNVALKLALFFNFDPSRIKRVTIVADSSSSGRRRRRQISSILLNIEIRDEPQNTSTATSGIGGQVISNIASNIINSYQSGDLQVAWKDLNITNGVVPINMTVQEPSDQSLVSLSVINRTELIISPAECRQQSPCTIQPVLVAYDADGNIIQKLGSIDRPWQVKAALINDSNIVLPGAIANYSNGRTQYTLFNLPNTGIYQVQFTFLQPDGVPSAFIQTADLTVQASPTTVTHAILDGQQVNNIYVVDVNDTFDISVMPIDSITRLQLGAIQWGNWTWKANITLRSLPKYNRGGVLSSTPLSRTDISLAAGTVTVTGLKIDAIGMYILTIRLVSTDTEYSIEVASNGILVKENDDSFISEVDDLSCNITFEGDYDAFNASNQLELTRAMIYNYLLSIGMPLISDITLMKGSVVALFQVGSQPTSISQAVTSVLSNPSAVPGLTVSSMNINGQSYSPSSYDNNSNDSTVGRNVGLIVGLVVGLVGCLILVIVLIFVKRAHAKSIRRHRLVVEPSDDMNLHGINQSNASLPREDVPTRFERNVEKFISPPVSAPCSPPTTRLNSARSPNNSRPPSADISVHLSDHNDLNDRPRPRKLLPPLKLIDFD